MLTIENLHAQIEGKDILKGIDLDVKGSLFLNNIDSSLVIKKGCLWNDKSIPWKEIF